MLGSSREDFRKPWNLLASVIYFLARIETPTEHSLKQPISGLEDFQKSTANFFIETATKNQNLAISTLLLLCVRLKFMKWSDRRGLQQGIRKLYQFGTLHLAHSINKNMSSESVAQLICPKRAKFTLWISIWC